MGRCRDHRAIIADEVTYPWSIGGAETGAVFVQPVEPTRSVSAMIDGALVGGPVQLAYSVSAASYLLHMIATQADH